MIRAPSHDAPVVHLIEPGSQGTSVVAGFPSRPSTFRDRYLALAPDRRVGDDESVRRQELVVCSDGGAAGRCDQIDEIHERLAHKPPTAGC
jgi:hypothetical protein